MMEDMVRYKGRWAQTRIYLGKLLRMFVYQNDWKVLPMGAFIAAVVTLVVGANMFVTQEGTINGAFALTCVCIWNGFFNSIQVVCRERAVIKREHRAGLHMSSYIAAHMIYQLVLCLAQTVVTMVICRMTGVQFPAKGLVTPWGQLDMSVTILLILYAADMLALMVSCIVRTTTTAMTVMPFLLIFQLVFSGAFFELQGIAQKLSSLTISKWGMEGICSIGRFNEQPMVTLWNTMFQFRNVEYMGTKPILETMRTVETEGRLDDFLLWSGANNQNPLYAGTIENVLGKWGMLLLLIVIFAVVGVMALEFIDRDKR